MYIIYMNELFIRDSLFDFCDEIAHSSEKYDPEKNVSKEDFVEKILDLTDAAGNSIFFFKDKKGILSFICDEIKNCLDSDFYQDCDDLRGKLWQHHDLLEQLEAIM